MKQAVTVIALAFVTCLQLVPHVPAVGVTLLSGDVYVEVVLSLYTKMHENGTCYDIDTEVVQNLMAIKYTFEKLKAVEYPYKNFAIGLRVSATCRSPVLTANIAHQLSTEMLNNKSSNILGVIGSDYSSETETISRLLSALPEQYRLVQLGYATTSASLSNRQLYGNFFRTIPPDDIQAGLMTRFMESLDWTYTALLYENDAYGRGGRDAIMAAIKSRDICIPVQLEIDPSSQNVSDLLLNHVINTDVPIHGMIVFGSYTLVASVLTAMQEIGNSPNVTAPVFLFSEAATYIEGEFTNVSRGAFVLSPPRMEIKEFQTYWEQLLSNEDKINENVWLCDVYKKVSGDASCATVTTNANVANAIPSSVYNHYAIQASLTMAKVIGTVVEDSNCGWANKTCHSDIPKKRFIDVLNNNFKVDLDNDFPKFRIEEYKEPRLELTFNGSTEPWLPAQFPLYEVYIHRTCQGNPSKFCLKQVAQLLSSNEFVVKTNFIVDYDENGTEISWPNIRKPQCPDGYICDKCLETVEDDSTLYIPGDMYIVGIVPVHSKGVTPLKCDGIKPGGLDVVEAVRFGITEAQTSYKDKVPTGKIGVIIIDSCNDPQIIQEKVLSLHRYGVFKNGKYIPVDQNIIGYIGGWSSDVSIAVAEITSRLGYAQISYASTAQQLSKMSLYPYFLRVPSPDTEQARTLLSLVKEFNSDVVQIVYSGDSVYGEGGKDLLLSMADIEGICILNTIAVGEQYDPNQLLPELRKNKQANIVIAFVDSFDVERIVRPLNAGMSRNEFTFITSEGWGTRAPVTNLKNLIGTLTLASELQINDKFKDYLKDLKPDKSDVDPWIRSYLEHYFGCYYQWSYNKTTRQQCTGQESINVYDTDYRIDAWAPFTERAVLTLLLGTKEALVDNCGTSATICQAFKTNITGFVDTLKGQLVKEESSYHRVFDKNGDGLAGYKIYTVSLETTGQYKYVGSSEPGEKLLFNKPAYEAVRQAPVVSTCDKSAACAACFPTPDSEKENSLSVGLIVMIAVLGFLCCALAGILLYICNRRGCCIKFEHGRPKFAATYLTPVYMQRSENPDGIDNSHPSARQNRSYSDKEEYDSIPDYRVGDGDFGSGGRRPPIGGAQRTGYSQDSGVGSHSRGSLSGTSRQGASNQGFSAGSSNQGYSGDGSSGHSDVSNDINLNANRGTVEYQPDGSYITTSGAGLGQGRNIAHRAAPMPPPGAGYIGSSAGERNVSDQSNRLDSGQSVESDTSVGYLRSVQTVDI